jgi:Papain-like cysteine protease AvrRpt2
VTAVARYPQHLDVFAVGTDSRVYSTWWDITTGWANWFQVAGGLARPGSSVTALARNPNHLDLFVVGTDQGIYSTWWDASTGWAADWFRVAGGSAAPNTSIAAIARNPNHLDLFAVGTDHRIYSTWWDASTGWANWFRVADGAAAPDTTVNALSRYPDVIDVFAVGTNQDIYSIWWIDEILFDMQPQTESNWCWAATSTSVALFYNPSSGWEQCTVANGELGRTDCCGSGASGPCNVPWYLQDALSLVGRLDHMDNGVATVTQIETEVTFARPLCLRVAWSGGGAHFLAIRGHFAAGGTDFISVDDPIYGKSDVSYTTLQSSYQGSGTWTHTYYTKY